MYKNRVICISGRGFRHWIGVLETCQRPARYYAGPIVMTLHDGEWLPTANDTNMFHCELYEARKAFEKMEEKKS